MPTDVVMPQMGESIFEGTITKWLKKAGDAVQKDEPLFEISTDKVDAEIPSPVTGILQDIKVPEGETVTVNTVVAVVAHEAAAQGSSGAASAAPRPAQQDPLPAPKPQPATAPAAAPPAQPPESQSPSAQPETAPQAQLAAPQVPVVMPQMGESIFEGTITRWLKKVGDSVQRDEPLFEISTDKVDAEIPSPAAGILTEIKTGEGETVQTNTVVAVIGGKASGTAAVAQPDGSPTASAPVAAAEARAAAPPSPASMPAPAPQATPEPEFSDQPIRSSPLVRRMAREHHLDLRRIHGTGSNGRITKDDVLLYLNNGAAHAAQPTQPASPQSAPQAQSAPPQVAR